MHKLLLIGMCMLLLLATGVIAEETQKNIFSFNQCPSNQNDRFYLVFFFFLALMLWMFAEYYTSSIFALFSATIMLYLSFTLIGCVFIMGIIILFFAMLLYIRAPTLYKENAKKG